jgi:hypothetical protein
LDEFESPLNRSQGATQLGGDLLIRQPLEFGDGDRPLIVVQSAKQPFIPVGHLGGKLGRRLIANQLFNSRLIAGGVKRTRERGASVTAFLPTLTAQQVHDFAGRNDNQQPTEAIAVV